MFVMPIRNWFRKTKRANSARSAHYRRLSIEHLEERTLLTAFTVSTTGDSAIDPTTLRYALTNLSAGSNTITFAIPGSGVHVIQPQSPLPNIFETVTIDGTMQTGYAGSPLIQIDGSMIPSSYGTFIDGLYMDASNCTVKGLDITGFSGTAIVLYAGGSNTIENNYLGISPAGTAADGNAGGGIDIYGSPSNQIIQNVISGNSFTSGMPTYYSAIYVANAGANGNVIAGNYIGTNAAGGAALGNGGAGIYVAGGAQNTLIGANGSSSASDAAARNIISANTGEGVIIEGTSSGPNTTGTIVAGNYIGTNAAGAAALGNENDGLFIGGGAEHPRRRQRIRCRPGG